MLEHDHLQSRARRLGELEVDALELVHRLLHRDLLEAFDLFFLGFGAGGHRRLGAKAVDELLQVGDLTLLVLEGRRLLQLPVLLLLQVIVVVAGVAVQCAGAQFEDAVAEGVEEGAIMRNDDQPARVARQVFLKPEQRFQIEMVGRLVEQQECGLTDQEPREVGPHHPAAGERLRQFEMVRFAKSQPGEDFFGPRLERVVDVVIVIVLGLELLATRCDVQDGFITHRRALLRQETKVRSPLPGDRALIRSLLTQNQVEQGGFARAVWTHQAKAVGARHKKRNLREEFPGTVGLGDISDREHVGRTAKRIRAPPPSPFFVRTRSRATLDTGPRATGPRPMPPLPLPPRPRPRGSAGWGVRLPASRKKAQSREAWRPQWAKQDHWGW